MPKRYLRLLTYPCYTRHGGKRVLPLGGDAMRAWWTNEEGEPLYSPEQIRAEETYEPEPEPYDEREDA